MCTHNRNVRPHYNINRSISRAPKTHTHTHRKHTRSLACIIDCVRTRASARLQSSRRSEPNIPLRASDQICWRADGGRAGELLCAQLLFRMRTPKTITHLRCGACELCGFVAARARTHVDNHPTGTTTTKSSNIYYTVGIRMPGSSLRVRSMYVHSIVTASPLCAA